MHRSSPSLLLALTCALAGCNPPEVESREAFADPAPGAGATLDHAAFDALLKRVVRGSGVDYAALAADPAPLDAYLESLAGADFDALSRDGKLAFLINAYNACTLRLILDHSPAGLDQDIPPPSAGPPSAGRPWASPYRRPRARALRAKFQEPRIHFAINCASVSCLPLRAGAHLEALEAQLGQDQARIGTRARPGCATTRRPTPSGADQALRVVRRGLRAGRRERARVRGALRPGGRRSGRGRQESQH
ncbi:MAG: DUF547 domain-containing protein [Planctomycetota bacterium]